MTEIKGLNILFVSAHFPYPLIGGERIKQYQIIKHLAKHNRIILTCLDRGLGVTSDDIQNIKNLGVEAYCFKINKFKSYLNAAVFSPFGNPMEIEFFRHKELRNKIQSIVNNNKIDLIINFFLRTAEFVKNYDVPKILLAEDCRSFYQERTHKISKDLYQKLIRFYESKKLRYYESSITDYFDITTLVTHDDIDRMKLLNNNSRLSLLSNGVDIEKFKLPVGSNNRKNLLFTAKLNCWTNIVMVRRLVREILPGILMEKPDAVLNIVGANPTREILGLQSDNVKIISNVDDISIYYQNAVVYIHPHQGGAGIQNKVLEAMACGCPVVTTNSGSRGISIVSGENGFIAENNNAIIDVVLNLLGNTSLADRIGKNARETIVQNYSWDLIYDNLDKLIAGILSAGTVQSVS